MKAPCRAVAAGRQARGLLRDGEHADVREVEGEAADLDGSALPAAGRDNVTLSVGHEHFLAAASDCSRAAAHSTIRHRHPDSKSARYRARDKSERRAKKMLNDPRAAREMSVSPFLTVNTMTYSPVSYEDAMRRNAITDTGTHTGHITLSGSSRHRLHCY